MQRNGRLVSPTGKAKTLAPVRPNAALKSRFQARIERLVDEMYRSTIYWIRARWHANPPAAMAEDETAAAALRRQLADLTSQWERNFDKPSDELADYFATEAFARSDEQLRAILRRAGISVRFKMTAAVRDALDATIGEQVGLIKSIPQQYLQDVQGLVMRSVTTGRDLGTLSREIHDRYSKTRARAAGIALDQINKATATVARVRQQELGITTARWLHSRGGRKPREAHVAFANGTYWGAGNKGPVYDIAKGMVFHDRNGRELDGGVVWPGTAIRCRCVSRPIVAGF